MQHRARPTSGPARHSAQFGPSLEVRQHVAIRWRAEQPPRCRVEIGAQAADAAVREDYLDGLVCGGCTGAVALAVRSQEWRRSDLELRRRACTRVPPRLPGKARIVDPARVPPRPQGPALRAWP